MVTARARAQPEAQAPVDFLIIAPLNDEVDALLRHLPTAERMLQTEDAWHYYRATIELSSENSKSPPDHYQLIVLPLRQEGTKRALSATKDAIRRFHPRCILLVGIAGGIAAAGARLGDVLVADQIFDYERQIVSESDVKARPHSADIDRGLLYAAVALKATSWHEGLRVARPAVDPPAPPLCHIGPMASGDKLIKDDKYLHKLLPQWPTLIGCEMEAGGVITAAAESEDRPRVLMIRGVSDLANRRKLSPEVKAWRGYACDVAACFAVALLRCRPISTSRHPGPTGAEQEAAVRDYCARLQRRFYYADHRGIEGTNRVEQVAQLPLEELYVLPNLFPESVEKTFLKKERQLQAAIQDESSTEQTRQQLVAELDKIRQEHWRPRDDTQHASPFEIGKLVQDYPQLVILGGPGSGKSTLLRYVALQLAQQRWRAGDGHDTAMDLMPLHVSLTAYASVRLQEPGLSIVAFVERGLVDSLAGDALRAAIRQRLAAGTAIVLCDGLDEVAEDAGRDGVVQALDAFPVDYPKARLLITSRPIGYTRLRGEAAHFLLAHFSDRQVEQFLFRRELAIERQRHPMDPDTEVADAEARAIVWEIQRHPRIAELAKNPLMLVIISLIREERAHLPEERVQFYECAVKTLMDTWSAWRAATASKPPGKRLPTERLVQVWAAIALWMRKEQPSGLVGRGELSRRLVEILVEKEFDEDAPEQTAQSYLDAAAANAGLLAERRQHVFAFWHPTFEEFLAAVALARPSHKAAEQLLPLRDDPRFAEVLRLAVGHIGIVQQDQEVATALLQALADNSPGPWEPVFHRYLRLAAACVADGVGVRRSLAEGFLRRLALVVAKLPYEVMERDFINLARSLQPIRADADTIGALAHLIESDNAEVRVEVARLLRRAASEAPAARVLCERFLADAEAQVRGHAGLALTQAGDHRVEVILALSACVATDELLDDGMKLLAAASPALRQAAQLAFQDASAESRTAAAIVLGMAGRHDDALLSVLLQALASKVSSVQSDLRRLLTAMAAKSAGTVNGLLQTGLRPTSAPIEEREKSVRDAVRTLLSQLSSNDRLIDGLTAVVAGIPPLDNLDAEAAQEVLTTILQTAPATARRLTETLEKQTHHPVSFSELRFVRFLANRLRGKHRPAIAAALTRFLTAEDLALRYQAAWVICDSSHNDKLPRQHHAAILPCLEVGGRLAFKAASLLFESGHDRGPLLPAVRLLLASEDLALRLEAGELLYKLRQTPAQAADETLGWRYRREPRWKIGQRCSGLLPEERAEVVTALLPCLIAEEKDNKVGHRAQELLRKLGPLNEDEQRQLLEACSQLPRNPFLPLGAMTLFEDLAEAMPEAVHGLVRFMKASPERASNLAFNMIRVMARESEQAASLLHKYLEDADLAVRFTIADALSQAKRGGPVVDQAFRSLLTTEASPRLRFAAAKKLLPWGTEAKKIEISRGKLLGMDEDIGPMHSMEIPVSVLTHKVTDEAVLTALRSCLTVKNLELRFKAAALLHYMQEPPEKLADVVAGCLETEEPELRYNCAQLLKEMGAHRDALIRALLPLLSKTSRVPGIGDFLEDQEAGKPINEDMQLGVHAARLLAELKATQLTDPLLAWLDSESHWRRREGFRLLIAIDAPTPRLLERLLLWLRSPKEEDWQLAGRLLVKHGLLDEELLRHLTGWWLSSNLQLNNLGSEILSGALSKNPASQPIFAKILRSDLQSRESFRRGLAARQLFEFGDRDSDVVDAIVEEAFSEDDRSAHLWKFLREKHCIKEPAVIKAIAKQLDSPNERSARSAYALLREHAAAVESRREWLRREMRSDLFNARISAAVDLAHMHPGDEATRVLVGFLTASPDDPDAVPHSMLAAETLLSVGREQERAVAALRDALASGSADDGLEAARLLHQYGHADEQLNRLLEQWLSEETDDESLTSDQIKSLLPKTRQKPPAPSAEREIEKQLRILASPAAGYRGDEAWSKIQNYLPALDKEHAAPPAKPSRKRDWWPRAALITTRAAGLAEQLPKLSPRFAELLVRMALPDAPAEILQWLLGPRNLPSAALGEQLARLVSVENKDAIGRFASAFWFAHMQ